MTSAKLKEYPERYDKCLNKSFTDEPSDSKVSFSVGLSNPGPNGSGKRSCRSGSINLSSISNRDMFSVAPYDIASEPAPNSRDQHDERHGSRVQHSVFERNLEPNGLSEMLRRVADPIDEKEDSFRVYSLCEGG